MYPENKKTSPRSGGFRPIMYELSNFKLKDMAQCRSVPGQLDKNSEDMEDVANNAVGYLYDNPVDGTTGQKASSLVRFF